MARMPVKGIFKVRGRGGVAYHYVHRGGPRFWRSGDSPEGSAAYWSEYNRAVATLANERERAPSAPTLQMVRRFLASPEFRRLGERTQADYRLWCERFGEHFGELSVRDWEDPLVRRDLIEWRDRWGHSPRQADYAATVAVRLLNWARDRGVIATHHCADVGKLYRADRSEFVFAPEHSEAFMRAAPEPARRAMGVLLSTGLAPGDACRLGRMHVTPTPRGRRIKMRRGKTKRWASLPVTPELGEIIDATPDGRALILHTERDRPFTPQRLSQYLKFWMAKAGLPAELRVSDTRGTAATRLLRAGLELEAIARHMGWSLRHAANIIERYATTDPDAADDILIRLEKAR